MISTCERFHSHLGKANEKYERIANQLHPHIGKKKSIVYLDFVQDIAPVAIALRQLGITSCSYHGQKMPPNDKAKAMENGRSSSHGLHICIWNGCEYSRFAHHTLSTHVILACCHLLIIFSLDVDLVIRVGCPPSVEQMVQELGRAGRDGRPCKGMTTTLHYTCFRVHVCDTCEFSRFIKD